MNEESTALAKLIKIACDAGYNTAIEHAISAIDTYQKRTWQSDTNYAEALNALEEAKLIISKLNIK